jgi:hypothetical protein
MTNVGSADRVVRVILGLVLILAPFMPFTASFFAAWGAWKFVVVAIGVVLVGTSAISFCPLYAIFGLRTRSVERP